MLRQKVMMQPQTILQCHRGNKDLTQSNRKKLTQEWNACTCVLLIIMDTYNKQNQCV